LLIPLNVLKEDDSAIKMMSDMLSYVSYKHRYIKISTPTVVPNISSVMFMSSSLNSAVGPQLNIGYYLYDVVHYNTVNYLTHMHASIEKSRGSSIKPISRANRFSIRPEMTIDPWFNEPP
jgi:hypothetical protein